MAEPFLSEIRIMAFNFAPKGWAECNGQFLPINQNQPLFALLGTTYGGNGQTTFALPDMRSRVANHMGNGMTLGERAGQEAHTVTISEMPGHLHLLPQGGPQNNNAKVTVDPQNPSPTATTDNPVGNYWADGGKMVFSTAIPNSVMSPGTVSSVGGSQAHENRSPFLTLNFCIALIGIFPSQN
jgi:microcystin-dependent protein